MSDNHSNSNLRSLQASVKETSILLNILQGPSGQTFASNNAGWDRSTPVCEWKGITCDSEGNVESIQLVEAGLEGTLDSSLGQLTTLLELDLSSNAFTGSIPSQLIALPKIKVIDLRLNKLSGSIPLPVSTSLEALHLGHNALTGRPLETSFSSAGFQSLRILDLKYNQLEGTLPSSFSGLSAIQTFDLSNNRFRGTIPSTLGELSTLKYLYLSNNLLTGTIPHHFGSAATDLQQIYLHGNFLTGTLPASLADLGNLQILFIDNNKLTGTVPTELCALNLNELFFLDNGAEALDVDSTYTELYGNRSLSDSISERTGCTSIACPAGYISMGDSKDGVYPCEPCASMDLNPYIGANNCFEMDQDTILKALYDATNGPSWTGDADWGSNATTFCESHGVTCNSDQQVTSIVLSNKGLSGTLPNGLGFLEKLVQLDVSYNNIRGTLPADLQFAPLEILNVAENQLTGFVPSGLCRKSGVNGNGVDGLYSCDVITCKGGTHAPKGRADPGTSGDTCSVCVSGNNDYMGIIDCVDAPTGGGGITSFGYAGEICIAILGIAMVCGFGFLLRRAKVSKEYIANRAHYTQSPEMEASEKPLRDNGDENESDPLAGIDGIDDLNRGGTLTLEVIIKDEWNGDKESKQKDIWLDVPKIT